jgi:capsular exopolysaccharide synthesis family protein
LVVAIMVVPLAAAFFSLRQPKVYEAGASVLLTRASATSSLPNTIDPTLQTDPQRDADTQAIVASSPDIAAAVAKALEDPDAAGDLMDKGSVSPTDGTDVLNFSFPDGDPERAVAIVNEWALQYTIYRAALDTGELDRAMSDIDARITALGTPQSDYQRGVLEDLQGKKSALFTRRVLETARARVIDRAGDATQIAPTPTRTIGMGLALGVLLGFGLAFLIEALDTRIRSGEEVAEQLGVQLLGRVPEPPRAVARHDGLVMLEDPTSPAAEPFRLLRTNLEFADLEHRNRTILFTSAVEAEGKSTTAANVAVAIARAGSRRVCLVDLDLRRPYVANFFGLIGAAGLTDVALGHVELATALHAVKIDDSTSLDVLPSGPLPPNPGEFAQSGTLAQILLDLRERYDVVIVDSPPLLKVGDPLALCARVDAVVLVARMNVLRRPMAAEVRRLLSTVPAASLGVILTGAEQDDAYGYAYGYQHGYAPRAPA